jgi:nucleoside-diphosphate-sugar epimerase
MRIKDARQTFAGLWIRNSLERRPFEVWGGTQLRDFNYVDDVVDALILGASSESLRGEVYNLGAQPPIQLREFAAILEEATGCVYETCPFPSDRKLIDIGDYHANHDRATSDLGWMPHTPIREAVRRTIAYFEKHLEHYV